MILLIVVPMILIARVGPVKALRVVMHVVVETVTTEAVYAPVDIFWVVDTSGSMDDEIVLIEERLGLFAAFIAETGLDYRIIVIGAQHEDRPQSYDICVPPPLSSEDICPDVDGERYRHVRRHVHSTEPLVVMLQAFEDYADFIRPNAVAHIINVTDDNSEISAEAFLRDLAATGHVPFMNDPIVHAIASDVGEMCLLEFAGTPHAMVPMVKRPRLVANTWTLPQ